MGNVKEGVIEGEDQTNGGLFEVMEEVRDVEVVDVMAEFRFRYRMSMID